MSLKDMLECIRNNNLVCLKEIMEDEETYLTSKICTKILLECLKNDNIKISNYVLSYNFDLDAELFEKYIETNRPFSEKQIINLNKILEKFFICCLINTQ